jgi:signal transduction histidine kinase
VTSHRCRTPTSARPGSAQAQIISSPSNSPDAADALRLASTLTSQRVSALGEMTAGLAHDFRTILGVVQAGLSVARRAGPGSANWDVALSAIDEAIRRGERLTGELLVFARGGKPDVHTQNVNDLLTASKAFIRYGAGPGIRLAFDLAPTLPDCCVDRAQFNAAILNLVVNARDAMPDGGEIRIATDECPRPCEELASSAKRWIRLRIIDQGSGMPPEVVEHLFDPYFTTKGEGGTGLGVPQVVAFMRASGGTVCVTTAPGAGTCFELCFPVADGGKPVNGGERRRLDRPANGGERDQPESDLRTARPSRVSWRAGGALMSRRAPLPVPEACGCAA